MYKGVSKNPLRRSVCRLSVSVILLSGWLLWSSDLACGVDRSPYRTLVATGGFRNLRVLAGAQTKGSTSPREDIPTISLQGRAHALGRFDVRLSVRRNLTESLVQRVDSSHEVAPKWPVLLQGTVALGGGLRRIGSTRVFPAAASVVDGWLVVHFLAAGSSPHRRKARVYALRASVSRDGLVPARVSRGAPAHVLQRGCQSSVEDIQGRRTDLGHEVERRSLPGGYRPAAITRIVTISTDADAEWYARFGANSFAQIAWILNAAEAMYFHSMGIGLALRMQHLYTSNTRYSATEAGKLLSQFVLNPDNSQNLATSIEEYATEVDAKHLFTGKDLDGSAAGIAYIRSICEYPTLTFGLSQFVHESTAPAVFAHELAHNLGAYHDLQDPRSLMYPSLTIAGDVQFSALSRGEIETYLRDYGDCLHAEARQAPSTPLPSPPGSPGADSTAQLSLTMRVRAVPSDRRFVSVRGRLADASAGTVSGYKIELLRNRRVIASRTTNTAGRVAFLVSRRSQAARSDKIFLRVQAFDIRSETFVLKK
jgi:hypothetical protein